MILPCTEENKQRLRAAVAQGGARDIEVYNRRRKLGTVTGHSMSFTSHRCHPDCGALPSPPHPINAEYTYVYFLQ